MADNVKLDLVAFRRFLNKTVQPYLLNKAEEIAQEARRRAPVGATSQLRNSIRVEPGPNGGARISITADYAAYVVDGTGPQATPPRPQYYPKLRRRGLIMWSNSKNLNPYQVAHGISQKGTKPNPFLEESVAAVLKKYDFRWIRRES